MRQATDLPFQTLERRILTLVELCGVVPGMALLLLDRDLLVLEAGQGFSRLTGLSPAQCEDLPADRLFAPEGLRHLETILRNPAALRAGFECRLEVQPSGGERMPMRALAGEAPDPPGAILLVLHQPGKRFEKPAPPPPPLPSVSPFRAVFEEADFPAWLVSAEGGVLESNARARKIGGKELLEGSFLDAIAAEDLLVVREELLQASQKGNSRRVAFHWRPSAPWGIPEPAQAWILPFGHPSGKMVLILGGLIDTPPSPSPRPSRKMVPQPAMNWVAGACHDVQTPLVSARGYAQMLLTGKLGTLIPEQNEALERILRAIDRTSGMVAGLDVLARAENGEPLDVRPVDLAEALAEAWELLSDRARTAQVRLELDPALERFLVPADPDLLARVFDNLLGNAVKFNHPGGTVTVSWTRMTPDRLQLEVINTGLSIRPEDRERIFEPFQRGRNSHTVPGSGLGLAVVKKIVERHGGTVRADAAEGGGTRIIIEWPLTE